MSDPTSPRPWPLRAPAEAVRRARAALAEHRTLAILVALLVAKQVAASWLLVGRPVVTINMFVAVIGEALLLLAPAFALRGGLRVAAVVLVDLFVSLVIVGDLVYWRQFADLPSVASLKHAGQVARVDGVADALLRPVDFVFLLSGPATIALLRPGRLGAARGLGLRRAATAALVGLSMATVVALTSSAVRHPVGMRIRVAHRLGPVGYQLRDIVTYAGRSWRASFVDKDRVVAETLALVAEREAPPRPAPAAGMNVVVVQMEALQGFALGLQVGGKPVTPNLDRLAAESLRFPAFFSQIGSGSTSDAELLAQCSLQPAQAGAAFYEYTGDHFRCLPGLLKQAGWRTVAMHANDPWFWGRATTYPAIGFETFYDIGAFSRNDDIGMGPSDAVFFGEAVEKLRRTPTPFYAVLLSLSSHMPFQRVPKIPHLLDHGRFQGTWVGNYLDAIRYADEALGKLVDGLRRDGLLDRTVLVVFGDHWGAARGNSNLGDYLGIAAGDSARWFVTERRVPLLVRVPGLSGAEVRRTAGQIDLAPTIAALVGVSTKGTAFLGRDLLDGRPGEIGFPSGAGADEEHLYLSGDAGGGTEGCYRLATLERVPMVDCRSVKAEAERELRVGWGLLDGDLIARAGDERARRAEQARETASRPTGAPMPR